MVWLLFAVLSFIFLVVIAVEILSGLGLVSVKPEFHRILFWVVTGEVVFGVISFWRKLTQPSFAKPPDIGGKWAYICEREDGTYAHGGKCKIELKRGDHEWEFKIAGTREWEANQKVGEEWRRTPIVARDWLSEWGTFTGKTAMHYEYNIQVAGMVTERGHG